MSGRRARKQATGPKVNSYLKGDVNVVLISSHISHLALFSLVNLTYFCKTLSCSIHMCQSLGVIHGNCAPPYHLQIRTQNEKVAKRLSPPIVPQISNITNELRLKRDKHNTAQQDLETCRVY